jgi:hypothetical protein
MERTVLEESWRRNGPVGPSLEVIDDDDLFNNTVNSSDCIGSNVRMTNEQ